MDIYFEELARQCPEILFVKVDAGVLKVILILSTKVMHKYLPEGRTKNNGMAHLLPCVYKLLHKYQSLI
mgnify:FL=1